MDLVKEHLQPAPSVIMQRFNFNGRMQKGKEAVAEYVAELRRIAEHCEFKDALDEILRDSLVCGVKDTPEFKDGCWRSLNSPSLRL